MAARKRSAKKKRVAKPKTTKRAVAKKSRKVAKAASKRPASKAKKTAKKSVKAKKTPARKTSKRDAKKPIGEGDYAASRSFLKDQSGFVEKNKAKLPAMGKAAEAALEGPDGDALREAEATAAARSRDIF